MFRRFLAAVTIVVFAVVLALFAWPQLFGQSTTPVVAHVVSLRGFAAASALVGVVALTLWALIWTPARRFAASLAVVLLAFTLVTAAVLASRGFGAPAFETEGDNDITVLAWNTLGDAPGAEVVAQLALDSDADVISLPETSAEFGVELQALLQLEGVDMALFTTAYDDISKARSTTLLISRELGDYEVDDSERTTTVLPSVVATPVDGTGPTIVAVHAVAPIPGEMSHWREDLDWLASACQQDNTVMAGDFNSTLDHYAGLSDASGAALGLCVDAASATDNAAVGTWPATLPPLLGSPIDHIMATPNWNVTGMRVVQSHDGYGSDHRPVIAQLSPAE